MQKETMIFARPMVEELECRLAPSLNFLNQDAGLAELAGADAKGGKAPEIRLDLVALHEFGHSLGLDHTSDTNSIMYAYYNANYDVNDFANDSSVDTFLALYADVDASPWKDSLDGSPGNGVIDLTYSFMPDGTSLDSGKSNTLHQAMDARFGEGWEAIFVGELDRWAGVSDGKLSFAADTDDGSVFNYSGSAQNDSNTGDFRIGAHHFDGAGKVIAHAYFPGNHTAGGDAHFDEDEKWIAPGFAPPTDDGGGNGKGGGNGGGKGNGKGKPLYFAPADLTPLPNTAVQGTAISLSFDHEPAPTPLNERVDEEPLLVTSASSAQSASVSDQSTEPLPTTPSGQFSEQELVEVDQFFADSLVLDVLSLF